jgi:hypothetical protein
MVAFYGYLKQGYEYPANRQPSEIAQLRAAVIQAKDDIISLIDRSQTAEINACTADVLKFMRSLDPDDTAEVKTVKNAAVSCLNNAKARIDSTDGGKAKNAIGIGFNTVAPITMLLYAAELGILGDPRPGGRGQHPAAPDPRAGLRCHHRQPGEPAHRQRADQRPRRLLQLPRPTGDGHPRLRCP